MTTAKHAELAGFLGEVVARVTTRHATGKRPWWRPWWKRWSPAMRRNTATTAIRAAHHGRRALGHVR